MFSLAFTASVVGCVAEVSGEQLGLGFRIKGFL